MYRIVIRLPYESDEGWHERLATDVRDAGGTIESGWEHDDLSPSTAATATPDRAWVTDVCRHCGRPVHGAKGDYWHTDSGDMRCRPDGPLAAPAEDA